MRGILIASIAGYVWLACSLTPALAEQTQRVIVVRPSAWAEGLNVWKAYRQQQGYQIDEIDAEIGRSAIQARIRQLYQAAPEATKFLLLCGDVGADPRTTIPPFYRNSTAMVQFGGEPTIATDNPYADVDDDEIPDLALGRVPADSQAQLQQALARTIKYENSRDFSPTRRNVHVVAGVGGFGVVADAVIEATTRKFLGSRIPGWARVSMTQASLSSHYCPDPYGFCESTIDRLNEGGMFWVYIGHGNVQTLDHMRVEREYLPIMNVDNLPQVNTGATPPIAIFLACYTGAFDAIQDSLAEQLVLSETGPVAAIAASRVSGPYGLAMLSDSMLSGCFEQQIPTLGQIVLRAKQSVLSENEPAAPPSRELAMIEAIAQALSPADYDLRAERQEHVWQVHLLGDPLLRINYPAPIGLQTPSKAAPGETLVVAGVADQAGKLLIELAHRRTDSRSELDKLRVDWLTQEGLIAYQTRYGQANNGVLVSLTQDVGQGEFELPISIPQELARGRYCVRAAIQSEAGWQVGYTELSIRTPRD